MLKRGMAHKKDHKENGKIGAYPWKKE